MESAYGYGVQLGLDKTTFDNLAVLFKREKRVTINRSILSRRFRYEREVDMVL